MSVDARAEHARTPSRQPSIHVVRARKLLYGGAAGGLAGTVLSLVLFGIRHDGPGVVSALLGAGLVLVFYSIGQYVMVLFADAGARTLLLVSLMSYTLRIAMLGLVLLSYSRNRAAWPDLVPNAVFLATVITVATWLAAEVWVFARLRISVYDTPYEAPSGAGSAP